MYDVIVVGARVAGSATARLLALKGLKVLCVDRASFPSDTISSHQVQLPGAALLHRWGLLERLIAAGTPPTRSVRFDPGPVVLTGRFPEYKGVDALYSPRRILLDTVMVDAAREAGVEVREGFRVDEVIFSDGRVQGIKGRSGSGGVAVESARLVIGADGKYSRVAAAVGAKKYRVRPARAIAYYAYWDGLHPSGGEIYERPRCSVGVWPTNDGLVVTFLSAPAADLNAFRSDLEGSFMRAFDTMGNLGERIRAGRRVGRFLGSVDLPNFFHEVRGPGWTLVGDAGLTMDPITGQGISQALQDAELAADAIGAGFGGATTLEAALAGYEKARNRRAWPIYALTTRLAAFGRRPYEEDLLYSALERKPAEVDRLLGVFAGAIPMREYATPANMVRVLGWRGLAAVLADKLHVRPGRYFGRDGDKRWN